MLKLKTFFAFGLLITMASCYFDNKEELYQNLDSSCESVDQSYSQNILPILNTNCSYSACHDASTKAGGLDLNLYSEVFRSAQAGSLVNRIKGIGASQMPLGAEPLSDCQIQKIENWVLEGALEN